MKKQTIAGGALGICCAIVIGICLLLFLPRDLDLHWRNQLVAMRAYILFLGALLCAALVCWSMMWWSLFLRSRWNRNISAALGTGGSIDPSAVARLALCGHDPFGASAKTDDSHRVPPSATIAAAQTEFQCLWKRWCASVDNMKSIVIVVLLSGAFLAMHDAIPTFYFMANNSNRPGWWFILSAIDETLWRLSIPFGVAAFLYAGCMFFQTTLVRRKVRWDYLCERLKNIEAWDTAVAEHRG